MSAWLVDGRTLVIGSGPGTFEEFRPGCISTDVVLNPWLDAVFDAACMPLKDGRVANIVCCDVLHHLAEPERFLAEASRVLRDRGRLVMLEPYLSPVSRLLRTLFHHERARGQTQASVGERPMASRMETPTELFFGSQAHVLDRLPKLQLLHKRRLASVAYPLSGGFSYHALVPSCAYPFLRLLESALSPLRALLAYKMLVVLERQAA